MESDSTPAAAKEDVARTAGRGVLFIATAKIYFMIAGAAIELLLPRLLGRFVFGAYGFVAQAVSLVNNVVVTGTIQTVSRYTAAEPERACEIKRAGFRVQLLVGVPLAVAFAAASPLVARWFARDPGKTAPLAVAAAIIAGYAFYAVLIGAANGLRAFHKQAGLDMTFATLRAICVLGAAAVGLGVVGAIAAWAVAAAAIFCVAAVWVGLPGAAPGAAVRVKPMVGFFVQVALYLILTNLLLSIDQLLLKRLAGEWFLAHGSAAAAAAREADGQVGYYRAVQNLARLPYQLMIAVTFVIFPLVSQSTFAQDHARTRSYIRTTLRLSLVLAGAMGVVLAANPGPILDLPYAADYAREGALALGFLSVGNVAFALFTIGGTILNGAGRPRDAAIVMAIAVAAAAAGLVVAVPRATPGSAMLATSAAVSTGAMVIGAAATLLVLRGRLGATLPLLSLGRILLAGAAAIGVGRVIPATRPLATLVEMVVVGLVYLAVLVITGELGANELSALGRVAGRRKP